MAATQDVIYAGLDLDLSWSERDLPERERTKHVHRLHPYLGKFIPQLVEELFRRHVPANGRVLDPFGGAGTVGLVAKRLNLDCVLIELNPGYAAMARKRIDGPVKAEAAQPAASVSHETTVSPA